MISRKLLTLDDVKQAVLTKSYNKGKIIDFSNKKNGFDFDGESFVLNNETKENEINKNGIDYLVEMLNLPKSLPNKLANDPVLMTDILNKRSSHTNAALSAIKKGKTVVSFVSDSQSIISSKQILDSIESNLKGPMFDSVSVSDNGETAFNIVSTENKPFGIGKKDRYFEGVRNRE